MGTITGTELSKDVPRLTIQKLTAGSNETLTQDAFLTRKLTGIPLRASEKKEELHNYGKSKRRVRGIPDYVDFLFKLKRLDLRELP